MVWLNYWIKSLIRHAAWTAGGQKPKDAESARKLMQRDGPLVAAGAPSTLGRGGSRFSIECEWESASSASHLLSGSATSSHTTKWGCGAPPTAPAGRAPPLRSGRCPPTAGRSCGAPRPGVDTLGPTSTSGATQSEWKPTASFEPPVFLCCCLFACYFRETDPWQWSAGVALGC